MHTSDAGRPANVENSLGTEEGRSLNPGSGRTGSELNGTDDDSGLEGKVSLGSGGAGGESGPALLPGDAVGSDSKRPPACTRAESCENAPGDLGKSSPGESAWEAPSSQSRPHPPLGGSDLHSPDISLEQPGVGDAVGIGEQVESLERGEQGSPHGVLALENVTESPSKGKNRETRAAKDLGVDRNGA